MPPEEPQAERPAAAPPVSPGTVLLVSLLVAAIDPHGDNPRHLDDLSPVERAELLALGESMRDEGQKQPIRVFRRGDRYVLVSGHRRYHAAKLVGLLKLLAIVLPAEPTTSELLVDQLIENGQREDFSDIEKMETFQRLLKLNPGWSLKELAASVKLSEPQVSRILTLKRLCAEVQALVRSGDLKGTLAYHIARIGNPETQKELARQVLGGLTRELLEVKVRELLKGEPRRHTKPATRIFEFTDYQPYIAALEQEAARAKQAQKNGVSRDAYAFELRNRRGK